MTTVSTLIDNALKGLAMNDQNTKDLVLYGINAGFLVATLLFEPPEMKVRQSATASSSGTYIDLSNLTRLLRVDKVYNQTAGKDVWPLSYKYIQIAYIEGTSVQYYGIWGNYMYYKPQPSSNETLYIHTLTYPARLTELSPLPFETYQDFVLSIALGFGWAAHEEPESKAAWDNIAQVLGVSTETFKKARELMHLETSNGNDLRRTVAQGTS